MSAEPDSLLAEAIESWEFARLGILAEAEGIPDGAYGFRPHERAKSVREILVHVAEAGLVMVAELTDPEGDFTRASYPDFVREHAGHVPEDGDGTALRELLGDTLTEGVAKIRAAGEVQLLAPIRRYDGAWWSRLTWMHHGIAHEEYHRGQLATYARSQGLVPALTRSIHGDAAE